MYYIELTLRADLPEQISTEIMYEIAAARADKTELLRINILNEENNNASLKKRYQALIRILKNMKGDGRIQFFATEGSFSSNNTEAVFLHNKYPDLFAESKNEGGEDSFVYIKI